MMSAIRAHKQDKMPTLKVPIHLCFAAKTYLDMLNGMKLLGSG
jgi:hypothetical protein